jgi:hypothetical protein
LSLIIIYNLVKKFGVEEVRSRLQDYKGITNKKVEFLLDLHQNGNTNLNLKGYGFNFTEFKGIVRLFADVTTIYLLTGEERSAE